MWPGNKQFWKRWTPETTEGWMWLVACLQIRIYAHPVVVLCAGWDTAANWAERHTKYHIGTKFRHKSPSQIMRLWNWANPNSGSGDAIPSFCSPVCTIAESFIKLPVEAQDSQSQDRRHTGGAAVWFGNWFSLRASPILLRLWFIFARNALHPTTVDWSFVHSGPVWPG